MSDEAEPMNVEEDAAPSEPVETEPSPASDSVTPASDSVTPPENPYASETEWGEDITADKSGQLFKRILTEGSGDELPMTDDKVFVHYTGRLLDGTVFDSSESRDEPFSFILGNGSVIKGWDQGVATMLKGEKSLLTCKPDFAYGEKGSPPKIPPNATLQFEVELLSWKGNDISGDGGVIMNILQKGSDSDYYRPKDGAEVEVKLLGKYESKVFDDRTVKFPLGEGSEHNVIEGIEMALKKMKKSQQIRVKIEPSYAWNDEGHQEFGIPPNATVTYEVTLLDYVKLKESWEYDTAEERKTDAEHLKERGNTFFKAKKFHLALKQYERATDLVSENSVSKDEEKEAIAPIYRTVKLNVAAVQLQLKNYERARDACVTVLEKDAENTKALYRRGQAYFGMQEFDLAEKDFQELVRLEPTNKAAQARLAECSNKVKALKDKEKRMYRTMFEKYAEEEEKDKKRSEERAKQEAAAAAAAAAKTNESKKEDESKKENEPPSNGEAEGNDKTAEDATED